MKKATLLALALCLLISVPVANAQEPVTFGPFKAERLNGDGFVTEAYFQDAPLTLLNYWATWCGPCVSEMPDLAKISDLSGGKVQVLGVMLDAVDEFGRPDTAALETMQTILEKTGVTYPVVAPDEYLMAIAAGAVTGIPTTLLIDGQGQVVDVIIGARGAEEWLSIAEAATGEGT